MPPISVGFWVQNSLNKGPLFGRSSLNMGRFSRIGKKLSKNGQSAFPSPERHLKHAVASMCPLTLTSPFGAVSFISI